MQFLAPENIELCKIPKYNHFLYSVVTGIRNGYEEERTEHNRTPIQPWHQPSDVPLLKI